MTVSIDLPAFSLVQKAGGVRFYRGSSDRSEVWDPDAPLYGSGRVEEFRSHDAVNWQRDPRYRVVTVTSGRDSQPGRASLVCLSAGSSGAPQSRPNAITLGEDAVPNGYGTMAHPPNLYPYDWVKIALVNKPDDPETAERIIFVGLVVEFALALATSTWKVRCLDVRHMLSASIVRGVSHYGPGVQDYKWSRALPVFNASGLPDRYAGEDAKPAFTNPGNPAPAAADTAQWWKRGHIWNYLRHHFWASPPRDADADYRLTPVLDYIRWPEASENGFGAFMFADDSGRSNIWPHLPLGGMTLAGALDVLVVKRGDYGWGLQFAAKGRPTLYTYGTGGASLDKKQRALTVRWGDLDTDVDVAKSELPGGHLVFSAAGVRNKVVGYGDPKRYDISFDTISGTLAKGWPSGYSSDFRDLDYADQVLGVELPSVYRRWVVPDNLNWVESFGMVGDMLRQHVAGAVLNSYDAATEEASGKLVRLGYRVERSTDGINWTDCPKAFKGSLLSDRIGVLLTTGARIDRNWCTGVPESSWSWDRAGDKEAYDIHLTVSVVVAERLSASSAAVANGWPLLEMLRIDEGYKYMARRSCYLMGADDIPLLDGGSLAEFGPTADDVIRDDTSELTALATRLRNQVGYPYWTGSLVLTGLRDVRPGDFIEKIRAGGVTVADANTRPDVPLYAVVREVSWNPEGQTTTLRVGE